MNGMTDHRTGNVAKASSIGSAMKDAREKAGLSGAEMARRMGQAQSTVSRWETGARIPTPENLRSYLELAGAPENAIQDVLTDVREVDVQHWLAVGGESVQRQIRAVMYNESRARALFFVAPWLVPGPLQTWAYAEKIMRQAGISTSETPSRVALRVGRREAITRRAEPVTLEAFIGEPILRQRIGGGEVMREQLAFLGELAARDNITLRVIPSDTDWHPGMEGPFSVARFADREPVVFVENRVSGLFFDKAEQVAAYLEAVNKIREVARSPEDTPRLLAEAIERYHGQER